MTLAFWVKPVHELSLIGPRFFPQVTLFSQLHPPQHVINQGIWFNPNGTGRSASNSHDNGDNVQGSGSTGMVQAGEFRVRSKP